MKVIEGSDAKQKEIASKLKDVQQQANNMGVQLLTLYHSRRVDASRPIGEKLGQQGKDKRKT